MPKCAHGMQIIARCPQAPHWVGIDQSRYACKTAQDFLPTCTIIMLPIASKATILSFVGTNINHRKQTLGLTRAGLSSAWFDGKG